MTLPPGGQSALRHWHTLEDEFVYVLEGEVVLVSNQGEQTLTAGMCAGYPAGREDGHHFINRSKRPAKYLEVGNRIEGDKTVRRIESTWFMPFARRAHMAYPSGLVHVLVTAATPIDDAHSQIVQFCLRSDREEDVPAADAIAFDRRITEEDRYILETTDPDVPLTETARERNMASDKIGILMRKRLRALLREHGEEEIRSRAP